MFKKIFAACAALMMLTACGAKTENTPADAVTDADTAVQTEAAAETEAASETEAQTEAAAETEAQTEAQAAASDGAYSGNGYTLSVDSAKWINGNELMGEVAAVADEFDAGVSGEQLEDMCDAVFYYSDGNGGITPSNFNVVTQDLGVDMAMDPETFGPIMEQSFNEIEGYSCTGWEGKEINGNTALVVDIDATQMDVTMKMTQYMFIKGGKQIVVTFTAFPDVYDSVKPDFDAVVNSIVLN
ncbi:MAG: hypothetical protein J6A37_01435 [Oscillospiraceae bacterium]|nr:hypothetical protein [Oscillospiraceae bacterium]